MHTILNQKIIRYNNKTGILNRILTGRLSWKYFSS